MSNLTLPPELIRGCAQVFAPGAALGEIECNDCGHINDTFVVRIESPRRARIVLQRINTHVFRYPLELMRNITRVTEFLRDRALAQGGDPARETLTLLRTAAGDTLHTDAQGGLWRAFPYIEGAATVQRATHADQLYQAGRAFGRFQRLLADFPADELFPVIPDFHNTPLRYDALASAAQADPLGRAGEVREELDWALARRREAAALQSPLDAGELPLRVTHNDTKINNVMLDERTGEAVCVIDLDTVMPGSLLFDFGDAIRTGVNTAEEDEPDPSRVHADLDYYRAYAHGYLRSTGASISPLERDLLPLSGRVMTYECGMRFLTDYLLGDAYFQIHRPRQNLDRARTQFQLVRELERLEPELRRVHSELEAELKTEPED